MPPGLGVGKKGATFGLPQQPVEPAKSLASLIERKPKFRCNFFSFIEAQKMWLLIGLRLEILISLMGGAGHIYSARANETRQFLLLAAI